MSEHSNSFIPSAAADILNDVVNEFPKPATLLQNECPSALQSLKREFDVFVRQIRQGIARYSGLERLVGSFERILSSNYFPQDVERLRGLIDTGRERVLSLITSGEIAGESDDTIDTTVQIQPPSGQPSDRPSERESGGRSGRRKRYSPDQAPEVSPDKKARILSLLVAKGMPDRQGVYDYGIPEFRVEKFGEYGQGTALVSDVLGRRIMNVTMPFLREFCDRLGMALTQKELNEIERRAKAGLIPPEILTGQLPAFGHDVADEPPSVAADHGHVLADESVCVKGSDRLVVDGTTIVYRSAVMRHVFAMTARIASHEIPVLILGETGVGKEAVAKALHYQSSRKAEPFMAINCAAIPSELLESILFGHKRGSFTGALSDKDGDLIAVKKGTLFLDEIGEMPLPLQAKILRVLQERKFRPIGASNGELTFKGRIVTATNRDLHREMEAKRFREDLFYRINGFDIHIPSLRERKEDIDPLIDLFLSNFSASISPEARQKIHAHDFPGNVRELEAVLRKASILANIRAEDCGQASIVITKEDIQFFGPRTAL